MIVERLDRCWLIVARSGHVSVWPDEHEIETSGRGTIRSVLTGHRGTDTCV